MTMPSSDTKFKRCINSSIRKKKNIYTRFKRRKIHTKINKVGYALKDIPQSESEVFLHELS